MFAISSVFIMVYITSLVPVYLITGSHYGFDLYFLMINVPVGHLDVFETSVLWSLFSLELWLTGKRA